jgi:hypothetical protein
MMNYTVTTIGMWRNPESLNRRRIVFQDDSKRWYIVVKFFQESDVYTVKFWKGTSLDRLISHWSTNVRYHSDADEYNARRVITELTDEIFEVMSTGSLHKFDDNPEFMY